METYQSLLGLSDLTADSLIVDTLLVQNDLTVSGTTSMLGLTLPTGAALNKVLTSDATGIATWQPQSASLVTLTGTQTLTNKTLGNTLVRGTAGQLQIFPTADNNESSIAFNTTIAGGTSTYIGQGVGGVGAGNFGISINALALKIDSSTQVVTIPQSLSVGVDVTPTGKIIFPHSDQRKRLVLFDNGGDNSAHNFFGFGKGLGSMVYQVDTTSVDHVFYAATSSTTSNELFRIQGSGLVSMTGRLEIGSSGNIGIGPSALAANTAGTNNVAVGYAASQSNTTGVNNVAIGRGALNAGTVGYNNIGIGLNAGASIINTNTITCIGAYSDTSSDSWTNSTALGYGAIVPASNTIQLGNTNITAVNTSGAYQINTKTVLTTQGGVDNLRVGAGAGVDTMTGASNVFVGSYSGMLSTSAGSNVGVGYIALGSMLGGNFNTACGYQALYNLTTGGSNVGIGYDAGHGLTTGINNTFIGLSTSTTDPAIINSTALGNSAVVSASNTVQLGNTAVTNVHTGGMISGGSNSKFIGPVAQGYAIGWNRVVGSGYTTFANGQGGGTGGFEWLNYDSNLALTSPNPLMTLSSNGNLQLTGSLILAGGYTFNYEEYDFVSSFYGAYSTAQLTMKITRIGRSITFFMPVSFINSGTSVSNFFLSTYTLPTRFMPVISMSMPICTVLNGAMTTGACTIRSDGYVYIQPSLGGNFTGTGNNGWYSFSCHWSV